MGGTRGSILISLPAFLLGLGRGSPLCIAWFWGLKTKREFETGLISFCILVVVELWLSGGLKRFWKVVLRVVFRVSFINFKPEK